MALRGEALENQRGGGLSALLLPLFFTLRQRLKEEKKMRLVSIETIPGQEFESLDLVRGTAVRFKG